VPAQQLLDEAAADTMRGEFNQILLAPCQAGSPASVEAGDLFALHQA
jgi:hypothetical protein